MAEKLSPLQLLESQDLETVQAAIAESEGKLAAITTELEWLRVLERAIEFIKSGRKQRKAIQKPKRRKQRSARREEAAPGPAPEQAEPQKLRPAGRQPSPETVALRDRIAEVIKRRGTPLKVGELTRIVERDYVTVQNAVNGPQFKKTEAGYVLAE